MREPHTGRKRILVFANGGSVSGAEIATLDLMRELRRRGHEIHCVANGWNDGDFIRRLEALEISYDSIKLGYLYLKRPAWTLDTLVHYPGALAACLRVIRRFEPELLHFHGYRSLVMLPVPFGDLPIVVHVHDTEAVSRAKRRVLYRTLLRRVDAFVAVSQWIKADLIRRGIEPERIHVAHPAVELSSGTGGDRRAERSPLHIGIVGQVIPLKGHAELLRALAELHGKGLDFVLDVYGRGPDDWRQTLAQLSEQLGIGAHVRWHGFVADRTEIYPNLDLVVVPSRDGEAFGMVAAEPAHWGLPVVASDRGGLVEIVRDEETGLIFRSGDVADLAEKIERLLLHPELRRRLGSAAREHVRAAFSSAKSADAVERAYAAAAT
jgi:glycosyltransferase involved in cell wall biosynthesis